jgi:hypothetical protein
MFQALVNDIKSAAGSLVARYVVRASVAVPFLAAAGFATAAVTLMLIESYGAIAAAWIVAGGFAAIGVVAAAVVSAKEQEEETAEARAAETDTGKVASAAVTQVAEQAPLALLGALLSTPFGPSALAGGAKMLARNIPLVVLIAVLGLLLWSSKSESDADAAVGESQGEAKGGIEELQVPLAPASDLHREAA